MLIRLMIAIARMVMRNRAHEAAIALGRVDGSIKTKQRVPHVLAENGNYVGGGGGGGVTPVYR